MLEDKKWRNIAHELQNIPLSNGAGGSVVEVEQNFFPDVQEFFSWKRKKVIKTHFPFFLLSCKELTYIFDFGSLHFYITLNLKWVHGQCWLLLPGWYSLSSLHLSLQSSQVSMLPLCFSFHIDFNVKPTLQSEHSYASKSNYPYK